MKRGTHRKTPDIRPADAVFTRLCLDIVMASDVERRVRAGTVAHEHLQDARALERGAWIALAQYMSALAWADPHERIRSGQRRYTRRNFP